MLSTECDEYKEYGAAQFYAELRRAVAERPNYQTVYERYGDTFRKLLLLNTEKGRVHFSGTFARTDYLLKESGASDEQQRLVNAMRTRLRQRACLPADEMKQWWSADLKALSVFISLIYKEPIASDLAALFPATSIKNDVGKLQSDVWRMVVERWDEAYIYGQIEIAPAYMQRVRYAKSSDDDNLALPDRAYLRPLLRRGMQINLVRPREKDGTITPEYIVVEPDILVDVSAVASCFAPSGPSPLNFLIAKLRPSKESPAITMGHLASQLLDDEVNSPTGQTTLKDSAARFYRRGALEILTSGAADNAADFWAEADRQLHNIHDAIHVQLPSHIGSFDVSEICLEPSFFSEMLGLQGRMDMMQLDGSMVLEQKSGKCGFPQPQPDTPREQTSHYVQLLLYMMILRYNFAEQYDRIHHRMSAFLMYSKYKNSLLALGYAPSLAFEAIKMRNEIAWMQRYFAIEGFASIERLSPMRLWTDPKADRFFHTYALPEVDSLLRSVKQADLTAKAYYYRFMRFVALEHLLAKIGSPSREDSGFAALWNDSLQDKLQAGNILVGLSMISPSESHEGSVDTVVMSISDMSAVEASNFRTGDIVVLYPYAEGSEPDVRHQMVFRCSISELHSDTISLRLRAPQADKRVLRRHKDSPWAVEHDLMEASYSGLYRGIHALLCAPQERLDLVLGRRKPRTDTSLQLRQNHAEGETDFNELALRIKQSRDIYLVLGPPGSGKTTFALTCAVCEELAEADGNVLLLAYTNRAVDEICAKLEQLGIDYLRIGSPLTCAEAYQPHLLEETASQGQLKLNALRDKIMQCRVFVGTTTSMSSHISLCQMHGFSLAVVDEASQILEPHLLPLLAATKEGKPAIGRFVLIGDHKQLPAVVKQSHEESAVSDELLHKIGLTDCRESIFQRFYKLWGDLPECATMLTRQGRMHEGIMDFPAHEYYDSRLEVASMPRLTAPLPTLSQNADKLDILLFSNRIAFVDVRPEDESKSDKSNHAEAIIIAEMVHRIYTHLGHAFSPTMSIGVIVPYRNQISAVRRQIETLYPEAANLAEISIDTVERYQGSQRDYIIYGTTVQKYYQLGFLADSCFQDSNGSTIDRKLNVAMTRSREHLYIVGNRALLHHCASYGRLIDYCVEKNCLFNQEEIF